MLYKSPQKFVLSSMKSIRSEQGVVSFFGFVWVRSSRDPLFSSEFGFVSLNILLCAEPSSGASGRPDLRNPAYKGRHPSPPGFHPVRLQCHTPHTRSFASPGPRLLKEDRGEKPAAFGARLGTVTGANSSRQGDLQTDSK